MAKSARRRPPVFLVIDTCVWLDLAKDQAQQTLLTALEELVRFGAVGLVTPKIVLEEFERNKRRVIEEAGRSIGNTIKRAKDLIVRFGDYAGKKEALLQLSEVDQKSVNFEDVAAEGVKRIEGLFKKSTIFKTDAAAKLRAAERAIKGKAPFHRQRNSMNDALLIELYGELQHGRGPGHFVFVTHNIHDFSHMGVHEQKPHPDIAKFFSRKSHYFTKLGDALNKFRPNEYNDIMVEQTWYEPPRRHIDIMKTTEKLREQVWYNRHQIWKQKLASGEAVIIQNDEERGKDPFGLRIHRGVWEGAENAARRVEAQYGLEELGPWDDFEWGMINGKLSALRWVLGDEWDMLDT